jgi:hypothetical protein
VIAGARHLRGALPADLVAGLAGRAAALFERLDARIAEVGPLAAGDALPPGVPWVPTASSVGLAALPGALDILTDALRAPLAEAAGGPLAPLTRSAWLRRQRPPAHRPPWHAPHSWHQDGALAFDFAADEPTAPGALAPLLTAWIPLGACGVDAPGLCWMADCPDRLLTPAELAQPRVADRAPALAAGDALVFGGALLHATHATPAMSRPRVSAELRFVRADAVPPRLRHLR